MRVKVGPLMALTLGIRVASQVELEEMMTMVVKVASQVGLA